MTSFMDFTWSHYKSLSMGRSVVIEAPNEIHKAIFHQPLDLFLPRSQQIRAKADTKGLMNVVRSNSCSKLQQGDYKQYLWVHTIAQETTKHHLPHVHSIQHAQ